MKTAASVSEQHRGRDGEVLEQQSNFSVLEGAPNNLLLQAGTQYDCFKQGQLGIGTMRCSSSESRKTDVNKFLDGGDVVEKVRINCGIRIGTGAVPSGGLR